MIPHPRSGLCGPGRFTTQTLPPGYPQHVRTCHAPVDHVFGALNWLLGSATKSLVAATVGFHDELGAIIKRRREHEHVDARLAPPSSPATGAHPQNILARRHYPASSIAIGKREHEAIRQEHARRVRAVG